MNDDYEALRALYRAARAEEPPTHADRHAVRMALAAAATVGVQVATTGAAASIPSLSAGAAAVGAKGIIPLLFGGKFLGGLVVGAAIGTAVSATAYVVDPPKARARVGVSASRPLAPSRPVVARALAASPVGVSNESAVHDVTVEPGVAPVAADALDPAVASESVDVKSTSGTDVKSTSATDLKSTAGVVVGSRLAPVSEKSTPGVSNAPALGRTNSALSAASDQLLQETAALAHVQSALNRKDPAAAMALLERQSKAFSSGQLAQEREAAYVLALCAAGRTKEAEQARARFVAAHPTSPLVKRVKKSCDQP